MKVETRAEGNGAIIELSGRLTAQTSPDLSSAIDSLDKDICDLTIDLSKVEHIASAGLRVLASADKLMVGRGGVMLLLHPTNEAMEILDMTGFADVFAIER